MNLAAVRALRMHHGAAASRDAPARRQAHAPRVIDERRPPQRLRRHGYASSCTRRTRRMPHRVQLLDHSVRAGREALFLVEENRCRRLATLWH